jgi:hypothetical protein
MLRVGFEAAPGERRARAPVRVDQKTHERLREICKQRATSPSRFVRLLVEVCVRDGLLEQIADRTAALSVLLKENCRQRPAPKRAVIDQTVRRVA